MDGGTDGWMDGWMDDADTGHHSSIRAHIYSLVNRINSRPMGPIRWEVVIAHLIPAGSHLAVTLLLLSYNRGGAGCG